MTHELVAIGASWGGLDAVRRVLAGLPAELDAAVLVVQHRAPEPHSSAYRELLGAVTPLEVCEPTEKRELRRGTVYIAPPDLHLLVEGDSLTLTTDAPVHYSRPSIDVLFRTAADSYRERCVGVVLTGANADGAVGLARIVELGGTAIVQDPEEAERDEMPLAALQLVRGARVAPVGEIAALLVDLCGLTKAQP